MKAAEPWVVGVTGRERPLPLAERAGGLMLALLFQGVGLGLQLRVRRIGSPPDASVVLRQEYPFDELVEAVEVEIGEDGTDDGALW